MNDARYYTGRQVQRLLGISEPALRNLVIQRRIRKMHLFGRIHGVYLKSEVDLFAASWENSRSGLELARISIRRVGHEHLVDMLRLLKKAHIRNQMIQSPLYKEKLAYDNHYFYMLACGKTPIAYASLLVFEAATGTPIVDVCANVPVEGWLTMVCEPDVSDEAHAYYGALLLRYLGRQLPVFAEVGCVFSHIYVATTVAHGTALALHAGCREIGPRVGKDSFYTLDVVHSQLPLLRSYTEQL